MPADKLNKSDNKTQENVLYSCRLTKKIMCEYIVL